MLKVATVRAVTRQVSSSVQVTGSFLAEESSDVAPPAAGRVIATPVDAGAFVKEGQLLAKLEDRDAQLRLQAALASEQQAEASLRQAESRIGLAQGGKFDANNVPEVLSAKASYDSAMAEAKMSEADAQRYDALIKTGDVSQSAFDKARTQADTAKQQANSSRQLFEASLNSARQNFQGVINAQASLAYAHAQTAIARKAVDDTIIKAPFTGYVSSRPVAVGPICRAHGEDRDGGARDAAEAGTAGPGIERAAVEDRTPTSKPAFPAIRAARSTAPLRPSIPPSTRTRAPFRWKRSSRTRTWR